MIVERGIFCSYNIIGPFHLSNLGAESPLRCRNAAPRHRNTTESSHRVQRMLSGHRSVDCGRYLCHLYPRRRLTPRRIPFLAPAPLPRALTQFADPHCRRSLLAPPLLLHLAPHLLLLLVRRRGRFALLDFRPRVREAHKSHPSCCFLTK